MRFLHHFVYGSWWVGLCAAALTTLSWKELGGTGIDLPLKLFVLGATVIVYNLNMLSGLKELRTSGTASPRHHWCLAHGEAMKAHLGAGVLLAVPAFALLHMAAWLLLIPCALAALLYVLPVVRGIKLREFGVWKIFLIATVWALVTVGLPASQSEVFPSWDELAWLLAERWLFIFAITIPFDVRDLATDAQKGVRTLPSVLGRKQALMLSAMAMLAFASLLCWRSGTDGLMPALPGILTALGLIIASRPHRKDMYYSFWLEGTMMLLALGGLLS